MLINFLKIFKKEKLYSGIIFTFIFLFSANSSILQARGLNELYNERALEKLLNKDYQGALEELNKSIKLGVSSEEFHYKDSYGLRAQVHKNMGNYDLALKDINVYIQYFPKQEKAYGIRQSIKYSLKDFKGAIEDSNIMLILNPNSGDAYALRGLSRLELGQKEQGCTDLKKAFGKLGGSDYGLLVWGVIRVKCEGKSLFGN